MISRKIFSRFNLFLIFSFFFITGCTSTVTNNTSAHKDSEAIAELEDVAYLKYKQRLQVVENLDMVSNVVSQDTASYKKNLLESVDMELPDELKALDNSSTDPHKFS